MGNKMKYSAGPYIYIKVDLDKKQVVEAACGFPGKSFETAERTEINFETVLDNALAELDRDNVKRLKEFIESDAKLKKSFIRVFKRKMEKIIIYYVKEEK